MLTKSPEAELFKTGYLVIVDRGLATVSLKRMASLRRVRDGLSRAAWPSLRDARQGRAPLTVRP